jgi:hypothetical protein
MIIDYHKIELKFLQFLGREGDFMSRPKGPGDFDAERLAGSSGPYGRRAAIRKIRKYFVTGLRAIVLNQGNTSSECSWPWCVPGACFLHRTFPG